MPTKRVTPDVDNELKSFDFQGETYHVKNKFKVARFLRELNTAPIDAIELVLVEEDFERFLDLEISMEELQEFLEGLSNAMAGSKN